MAQRIKSDNLNKYDMAKINELDDKSLKKKFKDSKWSLIGALLCIFLIFILYFSGNRISGSKLWETRPFMKYLIPTILSLMTVIPPCIRFIQVNKEMKKRDLI